MEQLEAIRLLASKLDKAGIHYQRYLEEVFHVIEIGHKAVIELKGGSLQWHQADGLN
jgi:hypothetical protein